MYVVIHWIEDLAEVGDCLESRQGLVCRHCWQTLTALVIVIADALEDGAL